MPLKGFQAYKANPNRSKPWIEMLSASFPEPIIEDKNELRSIYRRKLPQWIATACDFPGPMLIRSGEGIGKSSAVRSKMRGEAIGAMADFGTTHEFVAFAYRSRQQARQKAKEFSDQRFPTVAFIPPCEHLNEICEKLGEKPPDREQFEYELESLELCEILSEISIWNPQVYAELERRRKAIWSEYPFDGTNLIAMTHKAAQLWPTNANMRAWHHPRFDPDGDQAQVNVLSKDFDLLATVFDDPEVDDFVHILPDHLYLKLQSLQEANKDWRNIHRRERIGIYHSIRSELPSDIKSFYEFNAHMRIELSDLTPYKVAFDRYPYGQDNGEKKLYTGQAGKLFYIGPQSWLSDPSHNRSIFLTTEKLVADVIQRCFGGKKQDGIKYQSLMRLELTDVPGIYPIKIPVFLDNRARKRDVKDLVDEIRTNDPNSVIITNGVKPGTNVYTFQGMKGLNGLETSNIYTIINWFAPERYAQLNILGQWLNNDDVLLDYYVDQICQAVGRNSGFRQQAVPDKVSVTMSTSLWKKYLCGLNNFPSRVKLYEDEPPWQCDGGAISIASSERPNMNPMLLLSLPP